MSERCWSTLKLNLVSDESKLLALQLTRFFVKNVS